MKIGKKNFIIEGSNENDPLKVEIQKQKDLSDLSKKTLDEFTKKEKTINEKIKTGNETLSSFVELLNFIPKLLVILIISVVLSKTLWYIICDNNFNFIDTILTEFPKFINSIEKEIVFVILIFAILSLLFKIKLPSMEQLNEFFMKKNSK